jgi:hypothetical protein
VVGGHGEGTTGLILVQRRSGIGHALAVHVTGSGAWWVDLQAPAGERVSDQEPELAAGDARVVVLNSAGAVADARVLPLVSESAAGPLVLTDPPASSRFGARGEKRSGADAGGGRKRRRREAAAVPGGGDVPEQPVTAEVPLRQLTGDLFRSVWLGVGSPFAVAAQLVAVLDRVADDRPSGVAGVSLRQVVQALAWRYAAGGSVLELPGGPVLIGPGVLQSAEVPVDEWLEFLREDPERRLAELPDWAFVVLEVLGLRLAVTGELGADDEQAAALLTLDERVLELARAPLRDGLPGPDAVAAVLAQLTRMHDLFVDSQQRDLEKVRDVIWKEDKSLIRTRNGPQVWSAITNLVITLFRIHGVTGFTEETRRIAQDPRRALRILDLTGLSPG